MSCRFLDAGGRAESVVTKSEQTKVIHSLGATGRSRVPALENSIFSKDNKGANVFVFCNSVGRGEIFPQSRFQFAPRLI